jgi:hypothetical protein
VALAQRVVTRRDAHLLYHYNDWLAIERMKGLTRAPGLTRRCSQPLHRVQPQSSMINTRPFQADLAAINGGRSCSR